MLIKMLIYVLYALPHALTCIRGSFGVPSRASALPKHVSPFGAQLHYTACRAPQVCCCLPSARPSLFFLKLNISNLMEWFTRA